MREEKAVSAVDVTCRGLFDILFHIIGNASAMRWKKDWRIWGI